MEIKDFKQYRTENSLRSYGFTDESLNAIKSAQVITHGGHQQIVHGNDVARLQAESTSTGAPSTPSTPVDAGVVGTQIAQLDRMFARFKHYTDERITALEVEFAKAQQKIKELEETVVTLKSNKIAREGGSVAASGGSSAHHTKAPMDKPIDRNNVSPADIQLDNYFYCGTR